jgi:hypothetical protein
MLERLKLAHAVPIPARERPGVLKKLGGLFGLALVEAKHPHRIPSRLQTD